MDQAKQLEDVKQALANAAKYICNLKCGLCPLVVEEFHCEFECSLETLPWKCWRYYFRRITPMAPATDKSDQEFGS
jgi:hypothetical protein